MPGPNHHGGTAIHTLAARLDGELIEPGDETYAEARTVWNAMIDRKPIAIARCSGPADVAAAVDCARENDLPLAVKSGGHHVSGSAVCDDGIVVDCSRMDEVRIDPNEKRAVVGPGTTWGTFDRAAQEFGLATPGGQDPNIGVAGLTLGGGVGWLSRQYGLACDNLLSADVVTAGGTLVHASEDQHPDLFWGLRGGGGAFGVVTSFEFKLHEVGPEVLAGSLVYPLEDAGAVARRYREFMADAPREARLLFGIMTLPDTSTFPVAVRGSRVAIIVTFYGGDPDIGEAVIGPLRRGGDPAFDSIRRRSYVAFQRAGESADVARTYLKSQYLETLSDSAIETILDHARDPPSPGSTVFVSPRGGAETAPPSDAMAYGHRNESHHLLVEARWDDPGADDEHRAWTRRVHKDVAPYTTGDVAMNFLTDDEDDERVRAAYGDNYERLLELKHEWDPENLFRTNYYVKPNV